LALDCLVGGNSAKMGVNRIAKYLISTFCLKTISFSLTLNRIVNYPLSIF
jgi:hypothetical protein